MPISPEKKRSGTQVKKEDRLKIPKACFRLKEPVSSSMTHRSKI